MRARAHLLAGAAAGIVAYPREPRKALIVMLAGVLIDVDHYILYAARSGDWSPIGALRYDRWRKRPIRPGDTRPRYGSLRSVLHRPLLTIPLAGVLALAWPAARPLALGLTLHLLMDVPWTTRLDWRVWRRAGGRCERCGIGGLALDVYYIRPPHRGGDRWALENRAAWCPTCAREMYARTKRSGTAGTND